MLDCHIFSYYYNSFSSLLFFFHFLRNPSTNAFVLACFFLYIHLFKFVHYSISSTTRREENFFLCFVCLKKGRGKRRDFCVCEYTKWNRRVSKSNNYIIHITAVYLSQISHDPSMLHINPHTHTQIFPFGANKKKTPKKNWAKKFFFSIMMMLFSNNIRSLDVLLFVIVFKKKKILKLQKKKTNTTLVWSFCGSLLCDLSSPTHMLHNQQQHQPKWMWNQQLSFFFCSIFVQKKKFKLKYEEEKKFVSTK